ncbi:WGR domain protein, partial [Ichthyophthirius multifiliis]
MKKFLKKKFTKCIFKIKNGRRRIRIRKYLKKNVRSTSLTQKQKNKNSQQEKEKNEDLNKQKKVINNTKKTKQKTVEIQEKKTKRKRTKVKKEKQENSEEEEEQEKQEEQEQQEEQEEEQEEEKEEQEEQEEEEEEEEKGKKKKKKRLSRKQPIQYKKGQFNNRIPKIIEVNEMFDSHSNKINEDCCVRYYKSNKYWQSLIIKIIIKFKQQSNKILYNQKYKYKYQISTLFPMQGPDASHTSLELIFKEKDKKSLQIFIEALQNQQNIIFSTNPACTLDEIQTGYNDRFAYGVVTRKVHCSRGGKEGNNAFVADIQNQIHNWSQDNKIINSLLQNEQEIELLNFLRILKDDQITRKLFSSIHIAVRAGNRKLAAFLIEQANKFGGYGFNKVHEQVLKFDDIQNLEDFKKVSATKKSIGTYGKYGGGSQGSITPIFCAAINPNVEFLKKLLEISPEYSTPDDLMRKPIHYASACEGPGPLKYLLEKGVDSREADRAKMTTLMIAAQFGRPKNLKILLEIENGCNIQARTREGMRAIHFAAYKGRERLKKLKNTPIQKKNYYGMDLVFRISCLYWLSGQELKEQMLKQAEVRQEMVFILLIYSKNRLIMLKMMEFIRNLNTYFYAMWLQAHLLRLNSMISIKKQIMSQKIYTNNIIVYNQQEVKVQMKSLIQYLIIELLFLLEIQQIQIKFINKQICNQIKIKKTYKKIQGKIKMKIQRNIQMKIWRKIQRKIGMNLIQMKLLYNQNYLLQDSEIEGLRKYKDNIVNQNNNILSLQKANILFMIRIKQEQDIQQLQKIIIKNTKII